jgi:hypothetical protein
MKSTILSSAHTFLLNNARLLERRLFEHIFLGAPPQPALQALLAYRNLDGGFGNALEPDKRSASSQPIDQEFALRVLDDLGWDFTIAAEVCDFLQTITNDEGGVPFVLPTVSDAPRAPWWNCTDDPPASINPTASIAGLLHKYSTSHPWLEHADEFCWARIEGIQDASDHDLLCVVLFLEESPKRERAVTHFKRLSRLVLEHTTLDPQAGGYVKIPLDWAPTPGSLCHLLFDPSLLEAHLDSLVARQQPDGGWPITWAPISLGSELEYRGVVTLNALKILSAYGRL